MITQLGEYRSKPVLEAELRSPGGAVAKIMNFGAAVRDMHVRLKDGVPQRVVLGFESFDPYPLHSPYFGCIAGRVANRIKHARFTLDGKEHKLDANERSHCLHGGGLAMGNDLWSLIDHDQASVTFAYVAKDGQNGFPGQLGVTCRYRLDGEADLTCELTAVTDAPTPVNLAQHNYYNLDGSADIGAHEMKVEADFHTPNGNELLPTGEIRAVQDGTYDFQAFRTLQQMRNGERVLYDGNFVLRHGGKDVALAATVRSRKNGLQLEVLTDQPGLQFYDAHKMKIPVAGLGGAQYGPCAGFCLEPQKFPDAVNLAHFPSTILRPGESYRQTSVFRFLSL
jgi:aldose 1-epimerase